MLSRPSAGIPGTLILPVVFGVVWPILAQQEADSLVEKLRERYTKHEYRISMRDGVRLFNRCLRTPYPSR